MTARVETGPSWEMREGRWQDVLADVEADALISDPPYSPRQSDGFRSGKDYVRKNGARSAGALGHSGTITAFQGMPYAPMSQDFADEMAERFRDVAWTVVFSDHISFRWWESAFDGVGRYVFAPVVWLRGNAPRFQGDGPCSAAEYICVSRPRRKTSCGSLPGFYAVTPLKGEAMSQRIVTGQKPVPLMRALIRDYTRPGDLVVDPCAGSGTTLLAAAIEGRRAIGAEMDPHTFDLAVARLRKGYTPSMFSGLEKRSTEQSDLFDHDEAAISSSD